MREKTPGAEAAAAAHARDAPAEAAAAAALVVGCAALAADVVPAAPAKWGVPLISIGAPQLPQKRALARTGLLHLGQFITAPDGLICP
jgi:hypothetical protein